MEATESPALTRRFARILWRSFKVSVFASGTGSPVMQATPAILVLLSLLDLAAVAAGGYLAAPDDSVFSAIGLPACFVGQGVILVAAAIFSSFFHDDEAPLDRLATAFGALLIIDLVWVALQFWPAAINHLDDLWPTPLPLAGVIGPWLALVLAFAWSRGALGFRRAFVIALATLVMVGVPATMLDRGAPIWLAPSGDQGASAADDLNAPEALHADENLLYGESDLLEQSISQLAARTPGRINLYFIGFAGNGEQMVFTREVGYVRALFDQRFSAAGHSLVLLNNPSTPGQVPMATSTSLRSALIGVGKQISSDDVVVLFMTSHGSKETGVNVALPPFEFEDIDPKALADMFDEAHIRQRVVIVSACYSGIFVTPLANPNTLVITASDATHTSFGCSNEADFTYFGQAYFHDALASTNSLSEAFNRALPLINARETEAGFDHSNPQMSEGSAIKKTLQRLAAQSSQPNSNRIEPSVRPRTEHVALLLH